MEMDVLAEMLGIEDPLDGKDHLVTVGTVMARCNELFKSPENGARWLQTPAVALGNSRPLDLLHTSAGVNTVLNLLGKIEHGVFS